MRITIVNPCTKWGNCSSKIVFIQFSKGYFKGRAVVPSILKCRKTREIQSFDLGHKMPATELGHSHHESAISI